MKLVNYKCSDCKYEEELLFQDSDEVPMMFTDKFCPMCGGILRKFNFARHARWGSGTKGQK